jgi:hypothetical protein
LKPKLESHAAPFKAFLHQNSDNELYYFTQHRQKIEDDYEWFIEMNFLNLERVVNKFPLASEAINRSMFGAPLINPDTYKDVTAGLMKNKDAQTLLQDVFGTPD